MIIYLKASLLLLSPFLKAKESVHIYELWRGVAEVGIGVKVIECHITFIARLLRSLFRKKLGCHFGPKLK